MIFEAIFVVGSFTSRVDLHGLSCVFSNKKTKTNKKKTHIAFNIHGGLLGEFVEM